MKKIFFMWGAFALNILFWLGISVIGLDFHMSDLWAMFFGGRPDSIHSFLLGLGLTGIVTSILILINWNGLVHKKTFIPVYVCTALLISLITMYILLIAYTLFYQHVSDVAFYYFIEAPIIFVINTCCAIAIIKAYASDIA